VVHLTKYEFPSHAGPIPRRLKRPDHHARRFQHPLFRSMQRPTHTRLHVRDARDAHTVFEAVRLGLLRPVTRRLNEVERSMYITSGAIFVWEESDDDLGLKRWTDGRVWSQSRMREVSRTFLVISQSH
jgi:hypothetical protein